MRPRTRYGRLRAAKIHGENRERILRERAAMAHSWGITAPEPDITQEELLAVASAALGKDCCKPIGSEAP